MVTETSSEFETLSKPFDSGENTDGEDYLGADSLNGRIVPELADGKTTEEVISQLTNEVNELETRQTRLMAVFREAQRKWIAIASEAHLVDLEMSRLYTSLKAKLPPNPTEEDALPFREEFQLLDELTDKSRALNDHDRVNRLVDKANEAQEEYCEISVEVNAIKELITALKDILPPENQ